MYKTLLLSISSQDKPGVIETLSSIVDKHMASWQESRLIHLSGRFLGAVQVSVIQNHEAKLRLELTALKDQGILVQIDEPSSNALSNKPQRTTQFNAYGPDRNGIVKEIAVALSQHAINIEKIETSLSSMPYSGEPLFEVSGILSVPEKLDLLHINDKLDDIANELGIDIRIEVPQID